MPPHFKRVLVRSLQIAYGIYAVAIFVVLGLCAFIPILLPLGLTARRHAAHLTARAYFRLVAVPIRITDVQHLPATPCIVVANHASYLDGVVLKAALPARFSFVIKKEVSRLPVAGLLLRRIGSEFVDRFNRHAGAVDARRLIKAADAGQALVFFPEGTFLAQPGLGKFHTGAFAIAVRARLPVVPIAIRGTRHILPGDRLLPQPGAIEVQILPTLAAAAELDAAASITLLRDQARQRILAALGEPDLAESDGVAALQAQRWQRTAGSSPGA